MSEPEPGPKLLLHKPKKSQRSATGAPAASSTSQDGAGGARSVSTASGTPPTPPEAKKPWSRFRTAVTTLLVLNAVVVGYTLFRTTFKPYDPSEGDSGEEKEKEREEKSSQTAKEKEKVPVIDSAKESIESELSKSEQPALSDHIVAQESKVTLAPVPKQQTIFLGLEKTKLSEDEQQKLFKWMLEEKRKVKPTNNAEKAQIDAEKALLKDFLRSKRALDV